MKYIRSNNVYGLGNCSECGSHSKVRTVQYFLEKNGFDDIEYCCDILGIDPLEEVCEECFKSWLPELNSKVYSEYNEFGIDTRTGESFGEGEIMNSQQIKSSISRNEKNLNKLFNSKVVKSSIWKIYGSPETESSYSYFTAPLITTEDLSDNIVFESDSSEEIENFVNKHYRRVSVEESCYDDLQFDDDIIVDIY